MKFVGIFVEVVISVSNEAVKFSIEGEDFGCINIVCMVR